MSFKAQLARQKAAGLPDTLRDKIEFVNIGREKLVAMRAVARAAIKRGDMEARRQVMAGAQALAEDLVDTEAAIGETLSAKENRGGQSSRASTLPDGIDKFQSSKFQTLAKNKDLIERAKAEARENDDLVTRTEVIRLAKQREVEKRNAKIRTNKIKPVDGKYDVIVIDPPWPIEKIKRDISPEQVGLDYPTISIDEIAKIKLPNKDDCHLFLWTTQKYLPTAFDILRGWNFNYIFTMVWHKNGGFQPFNLPQYNCEFVLYGRIGNPVFSSTKDFPTCFSADRTGHSEKPEKFYEIIRRVTDGRRIDIFNRREIDGFARWGNEI